MNLLKNALLFSFSVMAAAGCGGGGNGSGFFAGPISDVPKSTEKTAQMHLDGATAAAGGDSFFIDNMRKFVCLTAENRMADLTAARATSSTRIPLTRLLDDVWYIGSRYVGQYLVKDINGFVVVDTLNNAAEAQQYTIPALTELGFSKDRFSIEAVFLTHGHGDHDGGAAYLKSTYNPPIYLGSADASGKSYAPIPIDSANLTPREIKIGQKKIIAFQTPGHTPGATNFIIPVRNDGQDINVLVTGGSSITNPSQDSTSYLRSIERTYDYARQYRVEATLHPHPFWDGSLLNIDKLVNGRPAGANPFVIGRQKVLTGLAVARECAAAMVTQAHPHADLPIWRVSQLTQVQPAPFYEGTVQVMLKSASQPSGNRRITFTGTRTGRVCTAVTDASGIAECTGFALPEPVQVEFAGTQTADARELPADITLTR